MLKSETSRFFVLSAVILVSLLILSFYVFTAGFRPTYIAEQALNKNSNFTMKPGDHLVYFVKYGNSSETIAFLFGKKPLEVKGLSKITYENCTFVVLRGANISTCIDSDGMDWEGNQSIYSQEFFFFSPWMLALSENFSWKAQTLNSITGKPVQQINVSVLGREKTMGREAFVVAMDEIGPFGSVSRKMWVDSERRVILREEGSGYVLTLIQARFPLQLQAE